MSSTHNALPKFSEIDPSQIESQLSACLTQHRAAIKQILATAMKSPSYATLIAPLDELDDELQRLWSPISHLNAVVSNDSLRAAYHACLPKITEYSTELAQNETLYKAVKTIAEQPEYAALTQAQKKVITHMLRDFHLSGIALPNEKKQRFKTIQLRLAELSNRFEDNVLDATNAWHKDITDKNLLNGLPHYALQTIKNDRLTLEYPCYDAIMRYADNRALREEMYTAYATRASDQGPQAGQWDNSALINEILTLRHELAQLLDFPNYAAYSLVPKMVQHPEQVDTFLQDLVQRARAQAQQEFIELKDFAQQQHDITDLAAWDLAYYSEKLRQHLYALSSEALRPYFPETKVIPGLFAIVNRLYGIRLEEVPGVDTWHADVKFFNVWDHANHLRGHLYMDLYARPKKRGGAWMDHYVGRRRLSDGTLQLPVAFLTCNFTSPSNDQPALFSHEEVETLFHEFGHCLQHLLTIIDYPQVAGINGIPWDAVELPSQFLEFWCWEPAALTLISGHYKTGETLPTEMITKLHAAKNFQSAMQLMRQLEFSLFDLRIHSTKDQTVQAILDDVRTHVAVVPIPSFNRFQHSFTHIFAGGYAAGYYSYKWAEVLASDAFSKFEEDGIFNTKTGQAFLHTILEQGGAQDPLDLFIAFRGRAPKIDALLRHSGIKER